MIGNELHNAVNEIFRDGDEFEHKIKCDLIGEDYNFCKTYYEYTVCTGEQIKSGWLYPISFNLDACRERFEIECREASDPSTFENKRIEIPFCFVDDFIVNEILKFRSRTIGAEMNGHFIQQEIEWIKKVCDGEGKQET